MTTKDKKDTQDTKAVVAPLAREGMARRWRAITPVQSPGPGDASFVSFVVEWDIYGVRSGLSIGRFVLFVFFVAR